MDNEVAELKEQVDEFQRQIWILTQGDDWLKNIKTQPLSKQVSDAAKQEIYLPLGDEPITGQTYVP